MKIFKPRNPKLTFDLSIKAVKQKKHSTLGKFVVDEILKTPYKENRLYYLLSTIGEYEVLDEGMCSHCDGYNLLIRYSPEEDLNLVFQIDFQRENMVWKMSDALYFHEESEEYWSVLNDNYRPFEIMSDLMEGSKDFEEPNIIDFLSVELSEKEENEIVARTWHANIREWDEIELDVCECGIQQHCLAQVKNRNGDTEIYEICFHRGLVWWNIVDIRMSSNCTHNDSSMKSIFVSNDAFESHFKEGYVHPVLIVGV